jgi:hypothetical protein
MRRGWARDSFGAMERDDFPSALDTDLGLLLRESDREDPILPEFRPEEQAPEEELDSRILAGLVFP